MASTSPDGAQVKRKKAKTVKPKVSGGCVSGKSKAA